LIYIIAGPNGAGKTTFAREFLTDFGFCEHFINADQIAQKIAPGAPEGVSRRAGRIMLQEIDRLARENQTFAFETTLSGKSLVPFLRRWKESGYLVHLFFLWLPSVEMALERVANRVRMGGHHVPEEDVRRRYERGLHNLVGVYRPLVHSAIVFDNSSSPPHAVVGLEPDGGQEVYNPELYHQLLLSMR
jgi:predicted ABC-type ATPase